MRSLQWETRKVVIKLCLSPEILEMALSTTRQLTVVIIFFDVTRTTFLARAFQHAACAVTRLTIGE